MKLDVDRKANEVSFLIEKAHYGDDAVRIAANVFAAKAEAHAEARKGGMLVTLTARKKGADLEALAGEFLNEALNNQYRSMVGALHGRLAGMLVTQALFSARGGDAPAPAPALTAEQQAETERLLAEAKLEIERTMPKRIAPQGPPIAPAA